MEAYAELQSPVMQKIRGLAKPENKIRYMEKQIQERDLRIKRLEDAMLAKGINPWNL